MSTSEYRSLNNRSPRSITMDRMEEFDELVMVQTTNLCFRHGCCRPSLNWVLQDASNYEPGSSPLTDSPANSLGGWIHEESPFVQRCCCGTNPGCRETRFVQHAGSPPESLRDDENCQCCAIQAEDTSPILTHSDLAHDIVAIHEKEMTCSTGCCCHTPYLLTKDAGGHVLGKTEYICDWYWCIPKFRITINNEDDNSPDRIRYLLKPATCCLGVCIVPKCGGAGGKCCRVPFYLRDPITEEVLLASTTHDDHVDVRGDAQISFLWSGLANELCWQRHVYHMTFPQDATAAERLTIMGATLLVDVGIFERERNGGGDAGSS